MSIQIMGMKYSGSSAVVDALVDQTGAIGISGGYPDETALFSPGRPHSPLNYFRKFPRQLDIPGLLALITEGRLGVANSRFSDNIVSFLEHGLDSNRSVNYRNFPELNERDFASIAAEEEILRALRVGHLEPYFRLISRLVRFSFSPDQIIVLNNDPPAHHYWFGNSLRGAAIFIVRRDPRDVVVDRKNFNLLRGPARQLEIFMKSSSLINLNRSLDKWGLTFVQFEEMVLSPAYRVKFFQDMGFGYSESREKLFCPGESVKNIGIGKDRMSPVDYLVWSFGSALGGILPARRRSWALEKFLRSK